MSRLEELIQELCQDGVEYKFLKECCELSRGDYITKKSAKLGNIPVILGGQEPAYYIDKANHYGKAIVISRSGASAGFVSYWDEPIFVTDGFIIEAKQELDIRFLYYFLKNMQIFINTMKKGGGVPHITGKNLLMIKIPIPPLPVQSEIVKILDKFTEVTAQLQEQLALEVTARRKQYEYYRDKLLTFDVFAMGASDVVWRALGEIADIRTGRRPKIVLKEGFFEYINAGTSNSGYTTDFSFPEDTVTTPSRGQGGIGFIGYQKNPFWLGPLCYGIRAKESNIICNKFLYYFLCSNSKKILQKKNEGGTPALNLGDLQTVYILIPSLSVQHRIVTILDRFDALCNDLASGLPAEIEARQKQYEYYRDKLLSFKERAP